MSRWKSSTRHRCRTEEFKRKSVEILPSRPGLTDREKFITQFYKSDLSRSSLIAILKRSQKELPFAFG